MTVYFEPVQIPKPQPVRLETYAEIAERLWGPTPEAKIPEHE